MNVKEIQACCLDILEAFQQYCDAHSLRFYMSGGTLLGAVRHKGYIPWDDDVDVMMPRPDYERFIREYRHERYRVVSCETEPHYAAPYARVWDPQTVYVANTPNWISHGTEMGAFIDIFPMDGFPDSDRMGECYLHYLRFFRTIIKITATRHPPKSGSRKKYLYYRVLNTLVFRKTPNAYAKKLSRFAQKKPYDTCAYVGVTATYAKILLERNKKADVFYDTVMLPFERLMLPAPAGYDVYLRHLYGDYMQLPPVEQRVSAHKYQICWKE